MNLSTISPVREMVTQYFQNVGNVLYSGDPEIRTWFLIRNDFAPLFLSIGYVIMTRIGVQLMRNRQPFNLRKIIILYNFFLVALYVVCLSMIAYYLRMVPWKVFCYGTLVRKGEVTYNLLSIAWFGYLVKYAEFLDTAFFILRKKEHLVSFLHVFHHAVVPFLAWVILRTEKSGLQAFPCILNSLIHIIMYTYYGLAAMGPKYRKYIWWKKYLTQLQITQFVLIFIFMVFIAPLTGCTLVLTGYIMDMVFAPVFLILFYKFYTTTFVQKSRKIE